MSFLSTLLGTSPDPKDELRPLWHAVITESRRPIWYREFGAVDTVDGRFDMIASVLAVVMLRLEKEPALLNATARLTELFVDDMDAQLRETGLGDPTLGKKMGKLVEALGGRLGAFRNALANADDTMEAAVKRNSRLRDDTMAAEMAEGLVGFAQRIGARTAEQIMAGEIFE